MYTLLKKIFLSCLALSLGVIPAAGFAHGASSSIEVYSDQYFIDIGYTPDDVVANTQVRFNFLLSDKDSNEPIDFTDVWVRIEREGILLFSGGVAKPAFGVTGMSYRFLQSGEHSLFVRYQNKAESLVELEVPFIIGTSDEDLGTGTYSGRALVFVAILGFAGGALLLGGGRLLMQGWQSVRRSTQTATPESTTQKIRPVLAWRWVRKRVLQVHTTKAALPEPAQPTSLITTMVHIGVGVIIAVITFMLVSWLLKNNVLDTVSSWRPGDLFTAGSGEQIEIVLTSQGYEPNEVTITEGTTVVFSTTQDRPHWPASNLHPSHSIYAAFDPQQPVAFDEDWSFTFDRVGSWKFHDHIRSYYTGTIHVVPE